MKFGGPQPRTPTEYVQAISDALDADDRLILGFYVKKFSILFPAEFAQFKETILNGSTS